MADDRTPITGLIPIHVVAIPGGAALDLSALTQLVVQDTVEALLASEDLWERLNQLGMPGRADDTRLPFEELVAEIAERCSSRVPLYGAEQVLLLTRALRAAVAPKSIPGQRGAA
ncbi:hypothetical protein ACGFW5_30940 [Streptomyces sp. NPDC048416]|uniref:hypothetical protein n=1 Tax=Streptomyces sp. NPDC048416 TaxID=3365546 RepID=UPI003710D49E